MAYNLYIVREDNDNNLIDYEEVIRLVKTCPQLELRENMEIKTPTEEVITIPGTYILWKKTEFDVWLNYENEKIISSYTEDDGISKLKEIAQVLQAKVIGDEGEEYTD